MGLKIAKVQTMGISGLLIENLRTKWHLGAGPMAKHKVRHKIYYKGEGGGFP
jgi:hypothetical protein